MKTYLIAICLLISFASFGQISQNFTRCSVSQLRAYTSVLNTLTYYINDNGKQGYFYYDPSDISSTDNTGTVLVDASGHRYKRIFSGPLNVTWFGAVGDNSTDCSAAISAAISAASGNTVYFPPGTYKNLSMITTPLINVNLLGQDSSSIITGSFGYVMFTLQTLRNASIRNLVFNNSYVNSVESGDGIITTRNTDIINFTIDNCWFTCPTSNSDALSFRTNIGDSTVTQHVMYNMNITYNHFINVGRVAVDIFNRKFDAAGYQRALNIHVDNNFSDSTGAKGTFGMFVSFDGSGNYITCNNNSIKNALSGGIELGNFDNSKIIGNTIIYTTRSFIPYEIDPVYPVYNLVFANNKAIGGNTYSTFFNINNSQFYGNNLRANMNTAAGDGTVYMIGCNNNSFDNEIYSSVATALRISSQPSAGTRYSGVTSKGNYFRNCTFINVTQPPGVNSRTLISLDSSLTTNNIFTQCQFLKGTDSAYFRQVQSSVNNYVFDNYHDGVLTNFTIHPLYATLINAQLTGIPIAPTAPNGTNTFQIATTAFVQNALSTVITNPLTSLGDMPYGGVSGVFTRLAGNITTTKQFLSQTGNGSVSAAPSWSIFNYATDGTGSLPDGNISSAVTWNAKAPLASPGLTGTPTAPTATPGTNTIQLANTAFVTNAISVGSDGSYYFPTAYGGVSCSINTTNSVQYIRLKKQVFISGYVNITFTAATTAFSFKLPLPFATAAAPGSGSGSYIDVSNIYHTVQVTGSVDSGNGIMVISGNVNGGIGSTAGIQFTAMYITD